MVDQLGTVEPQSNELTAPFWAAAQDRRLMIQQCEACSYFNHPPQNDCARCGSTELTFNQVSGAGSVYTYTTNWQANSTLFDVPYTNIVVELDEQSKLLLVSYLGGERPDWVKLGQRVVVDFESTASNMTLPQFVPSNGE